MKRNDFATIGVSKMTKSKIKDIVHYRALRNNFVKIDKLIDDLVTLELQREIERYSLQQEIQTGNIEGLYP